MVVTIKNKTLHKQVFLKMNKLDDKALSHYKKGNMQKGRLAESQSDKIYATNYSKIFKVTRK